MVGDATVSFYTHELRVVGNAEVSLRKEDKKEACQFSFMGQDMDIRRRVLLAL